MFSRDSLNADSFTWQAALSLAFASKLAYEKESVVEALVKDSWGFEHFQFLDNDGTQGFVGASPGRPCLSRFEEPLVLATGSLISMF